MRAAAKSVTLVAALGRNRAIGLAGRLPWYLPAELKLFRATTWGKPVIMGRKTFAAIGRALPGRQNIVVTRSRGFRADGCEIAASLEEAIGLAAGDEVMVIGGGELYREALPLATRMVLTVVDCAPEADTWFPAFDASEWQAVERRHFVADTSNVHAFEVIDYRRA